VATTPLTQKAERETPPKLIHFLSMRCW